MDEMERLCDFVDYLRDAVEEFREIDDFQDRLKKLKKMAAGCADSGKATKAEAATLELFGRGIGGVPIRLRHFADLCGRLAAIARKQLAGKALAGEDLKTIRDYGPALGSFHFYDGDSWRHPRDDSPMVTPAHVDPVVGQTLYVGLARPHALYVIARAGKKLRLFRGAVMSYREFLRPISPFITDQAWQGVVSKGAADPPPGFTRSFFRSTSTAEIIKLLRSGETYANIDNRPEREITRAMIDLLRTGTHPDPDWLIDHLDEERCTHKDVEGLIALLAKASGDHVGSLSLILTGLRWQKHGDRLLDVVCQGGPTGADAAAEILLREPAAIRATRLVKEFDSQSIHTRRLRCVLLGAAPSAGQGVKEVLLKAPG